ncbi:MAG: hypothetical protein HOC74_14140 [Gemmatimonadetes bacterium]|jgi:hypothetical protein|nr:hypothetical protein [Gemmatimonadota bacterium]
MDEMSRRERIMAASRGESADRLPFFHFWRHSQIGWAERECRNRGMGMCWTRPCHVERMHGVEVVEKHLSVPGQNVVERTYTTPVGAVSVVEKLEPGVGQWHGQRSWNDISPWQLERLIKTPEDYEVVKYMVENTEYVADYFPIEQAMDWLGEDGVVLSALPHSPMQMLMIDWVGSEEGRFYYHYEDFPGLVEELYRALCKSRRALHEIAARSPAPIALCGDNVDGVLVTPKLFERYFMPVYEEQAELLHAQGKLMAVHMDGRLDVLKELVAQTPIDIVEALHPLPMGDLPLDEALRCWPDKSIWVGFPGSEYALGTRATQECALALLKEAIPGERVVVEMSTENIVSNENLLALTSVMEQAELPLSGAKIEGIERSLQS